MFVGVYSSIHTGSTGQTYMWKDKDKHDQKKKCFSHTSNKLYRKSQKEERGEGVRRKEEDRVRDEW